MKSKSINDCRIPMGVSMGLASLRLHHVTETEFGVSRQFHKLVRPLMETRFSVCGNVLQFMDDYTGFRQTKDVQPTTAAEPIEMKELDPQAVDAMDRVRQSAAEHASVASQAGRVPAISITHSFVKGREASAQGDLYLMPIDPINLQIKEDGTATLTIEVDGQQQVHTFVRLEKPMTQLVWGKSAGAKHCLQSTACVKEMYLPKDWDDRSLFGPIFTLHEDKPAVVDHPTHGDVNIEAGLTVFAFYQRSRVKDLNERNRD